MIKKILLMLGLFFLGEILCYIVYYFSGSNIATPAIMLLFGMIFVSIIDDFYLKNRKCGNNFVGTMWEQFCGNKWVKTVKK